ncbi:PKHD-type hydroxylase [compost metagenome]
MVEDTYGQQRVKLPAGHMVLYPATSIHHVTPVTRGARVSSFFWIQSMVRDDGQRSLLFEMDARIRQTAQELGQSHEAVIGLTGVYHNLLRRWADA